MGHTPGPWRAATNSAWCKVLNVRKDYNAIAFVQSDNEADARLIAAAPDLLEALEGLITAMEGIGHGPFDHERAVIAKAKGET